MANESPTLPLDEDKQLPVPRIGKDELNLAEFPFAILANRVPEEVKTIVVRDTVTGKDGKPIHREWIVTGADAFGLPRGDDEKVYVALMEISREEGFRSRQVFFSRYDLIQRIGWPHTGQYYQRIIDALDRLKGVSFVAHNAFWDKEQKAYATRAAFGLLENYVVFDEPRGRKADESASLPRSYIVWNERFFQSMQQGNLKQLDTDFYFSLKSHIAQRLFRYLDRKRYDGKPMFSIGLLKLAKNHLYFQDQENLYPSVIKQRLDPAHQELIEKGFLSEVRYRQGNEEEVVEYVYNPHWPRWNSFRPFDSPEHTEETDLVEALTAVGVTRTVAQRLVKDHPATEIRRQLDYLPYRQAEDPAALLVKAIEESWAEPQAYRQAQEEEEQKRQQEEAARRQAEAAAEAEWKRQERQERIESLKAQLSPEELEELFDEALQAWAPGTQRWYREKGIEAATSQALIDAWIARKYLGWEEGE